MASNNPDFRFTDNAKFPGRCYNNIWMTGIFAEAMLFLLLSYAEKLIHFLGMSIVNLGIDSTRRTSMFLAPIITPTVKAQVE